MELQVVNISLLASLAFVVNLVRRKGYKSKSFTALLVLFLLMIPIAFIAAGLNASIDKTNKMSFNAFGKYYKRARLEMKLARPTVNYVHNSTDDQNQTTTAELSTISSVLPMSNTLPSNHTIIINQVSAKNEVDLVVLSSFNCYSKFPEVIHEYINNTFRSEFKLSHNDIHKNYNDSAQEQILPLLTDVSTSCKFGQGCTTTLDYDKQYGTNTTFDNKLLVNGSFYCCSYAVGSADPKVCQEAKLKQDKSTLRESKEPVLLVDENSDFFMTNLAKMYNEMNYSDNVLEMIKVSSPDVLRLRY